MSILEENIGKLIAGAVALVGAGLTWIVRTVFTNNKRVDLLEQSIQDSRKHLDERHLEIKESILKVEKQTEVSMINQQKLIEALLKKFEKDSHEKTSH